MIRILSLIAVTQTIMSERISVDTNVILYALNEADLAKKKVALSIISDLPLISSQVLSETVNVCRRKWKYDKYRQIKVAEFLLRNCQLLPVGKQTVELAHALIKRYDFQYFDSIIVASALEVNCTVLYSEDLHHNLLVEKQLRILNPFL